MPARRHQSLRFARGRPTNPARYTARPADEVIGRAGRYETHRSPSMPVNNRIADFHAEMTAWRRDFHEHPELAFEEHRTSEIVADKLRSFGCDEVQGFLLGKPMLPQQLSAILGGAEPVAS